eukprot:NODE_3595_length_755_cov_148.359773_g3014_i0.p1 GENE.NODE_3595_length_755_cov_148.359773_g3014_i0~~NODE_3595_length_755_cov_148.359773_g3014_i0.p1  ORF type:complete len:84 (-),score=12.74 NODE_3595_length_755_cov_148.359773_g3014_i0:472-723(-)
MANKSQLYKGLVDAATTYKVPQCFGIARNYSISGKENPKEHFPEYPFIFHKPLASLSPKGENFKIPSNCGAVNYEAELGVMFN